MNQFYLHSSPSGIKLIEGDKMPVKPVICTLATKCIYPDKVSCKCYKERDEYEAALQRAKDEAVNVADQDAACRVIYPEDKLARNFKIDEIGCLSYQSGNDHCQRPYKFDTIYGPFSLRYEMKTVLSTGWVPSYNDPDNISGHPNAEPMEVAILYDEFEKKE
jgi:hypothetical protein